jgi:hypothetical protein
MVWIMIGPAIPVERSPPIKKDCIIPVTLLNSRAKYTPVFRFCSRLFKDGVKPPEPFIQGFRDFIIISEVSHVSHGFPGQGALEKCDHFSIA